MTFCQRANSPFQGLGADATGNAFWEITRACYEPMPCAACDGAANGCEWCRPVHGPGISALLGSRLVNYVYDEYLGECDEPVVHEEQPRILVPEPSAFAWGNSKPASASASPSRDPDDDRMPGETWVQRVYRGPSANTPSVSLRNRLRRAAFFDKRERDVAAGVAEPVEMDAGLPDAMVDEREREFA